MALCLENLIRLNKVRISLCLGNTWEVQMDGTNKAPCSHLDTDIRRSEWRRSYCSHTWYLFHRKLKDPWIQSDREKSLTSPLAFILLTDMYWILTAVVRNVMFFLEQLLSNLVLLKLSVTVFKILLFLVVSRYYCSVNEGILKHDQQVATLYSTLYYCQRSTCFERFFYSLRYNTSSFCKYLPKFLRNILRPSLWLSQKCRLLRLTW
jgi:hypothetical protein